MKPMNMLIVGMTACGKTYYLVNLLQNELQYKYDQIFLLCPTFHYNAIWNIPFVYDDPRFYVLPCAKDDVDDTMRKVISYASRSPSLIISDDCASTKSVKNRSGELVRLAFGGRHMGISTIVLTHQLTSVAKAY
jgi:GTPase SAR1 family protein